MAFAALFEYAGEPLEDVLGLEDLDILTAYFLDLDVLDYLQVGNTFQYLL